MLLAERGRESPLFIEYFLVFFVIVIETLKNVLSV